MDDVWQTIVQFHLPPSSAARFSRASRSFHALVTEPLLLNSLASHFFRIHGQNALSNLIMWFSTPSSLSDPNSSTRLNVCLQWLLDTYGAHIPDKRLDDALTIAAQFGHRDAVELLLSEGADVKTTTPDGGGSRALQKAAWNGHCDILRLLLDHGANVHARNNMALRNAAQRGEEEAVEVLLDAGADIYDKPLGVPEDSEEKVRCAVQLAALNGHLGVVRICLDRGADLRGKCINDALVEADESGFEEVVQLLIAHGADPKLLKKRKI
ncbi:hypothetical protein HK104_009418 [Borealophlyctis nickersoniae]|nr:hypothetical protein HK104_009418 [Borealophlyctis nickersoniae]